MTKKLNNNAQKTECLKSLKLLDRNYKNAEKDCFLNLPNMRSDKDFQAAFEVHLTNDLNLKAEKAMVAKVIRCIGQEINNFKSKSRSVKPSPQAVEILKGLMESVEASLGDFKEQQRQKFYELTNDEKILIKEMETYEKKIQSWTTVDKDSERREVGAARTGLVSSDRNAENCELLKEVVDFDKFLLKNGGLNGGWDEIDHHLFLKIRHKHRTHDSPAYFAELERLIATKNSPQLVEHETWHRTFLELNEAKRLAIKAWRENRRAGRNEAVTQAEAEIKLNREIEKQLRERLRRKQAEEKQERQRKLNEWRLEKEIRRAKELEEVKLREKRELEKEFSERMRQLEMKEKLSELNRQRRELSEYVEMEAWLAAEAEREARRVRSSDIRVLYERGVAGVRERQEKVAAKEREKEEKGKRLERMKERVEVERDPERLYRATSTWKSRLSTPRSGSCGSLAVGAAKVQHLAVPSWRQGI